MSRPRTEMSPRMKTVLTLIKEFGPVNKHSMQQIMRVRKQAIDGYVRRLKDLKLIHVGGYGVSPTQPWCTVPMFVYGQGEDVKRVYKKKTRIKPPKPEQIPYSEADEIDDYVPPKAVVVVRRDPFDEYFFGPVVLTKPQRVLY